MEFVELAEAEVAELDFGCQSFLQSWEMYRRYQQTGREAYFVGVKWGTEIVAAGLVSVRNWHFGKKIFRVPGGWLMDYDSAKIKEILAFLTEKAKVFCQSRGGIALEISPNIISEPRDAHNNVVEGQNHLGVKAELGKLGYKYLGEFEQAKWTFTLTVAGKTAEELFKAFRTDHRQRIRRAERDGVRVRELGIDELGVLKEIAAEAGERHGFQDPDLMYYRSMKEAFGDKIKFVVAEMPTKGLEAQSGVSGRSEGKTLEKASGEPTGQYVPLAAAMFVNDGREIVYLYSGSVRKLQKYGGAHLIQWKMIQEAIETGCEKYNFYGVYPVEGNGVYNFKLGFRGQVEELLGTFVLPLGLLGKLYAARLKPREYGAIH